MDELSGMDELGGMDELTWRDELLFSYHRAIETYGWHVIHVFGGECLAWSYTVGLVDNFDHPELVVMGLDRGSGYGLLAALIDELGVGLRRRVGRDWPQALNHHQLRLVSVDPQRWTEDWFCVWVNYYGSLGRFDLVPEALQVAWADDEGRFPWESDFEAAKRMLQPLLDEPGEPRAAA